MSVSGRVAVVTGGAMGIGAEIARQLARSGALVAVTDVDMTAAERTVAAIAEEGGAAACFEHDVTSWDSAFAMVDDVEASLGPIAILVNNAGVSKRVPFLEMTEAEWDRLMDINLKGQFLSARAIIPGMLERDYGRIISMSSICGKEGKPNFSHYSASKFGVIGLTQSMAMELARTGVTVNAVCPGTVATPLHEGIFADIAKVAGVTVEKAQRDFDALSPQGRSQTAEDVARMVVFLADDASHNLTGGSYHVDGGKRLD